MTSAAHVRQSCPELGCALVQALEGDFQKLDDRQRATEEKARTAQELAGAANWKMNLLLGMTGALIAMATTAFVWLFTLSQKASADAVLLAGREARTVVAEQDRHFEAKATDIAAKAVRMDREDRAREGLTVSARR